VASIRAYRLKDGSTRYGVIWRDASGVQHWKAAGPRRKDADRLRIEIERKLVLGDLHEEPSETFGTYVEAFLERHAARAQHSTVQRYRETLPRLATINGVRLDALTVPMIDDLVVAIAKKTPRQSELGLRLIKMVIRDARRRGLRVTDAVLEVRPINRPPKERRFLTWSEVEHLAALTPEPYNCLVLLTALTGLRQGEMFGLRWSSVDLDAKTVLVARTQVNGTAGRTKTASGMRTVALSQRAVSLLEAHRRMTACDASQLVWTSPRGEPLRKDNFMARVYRPAVKRAGLTPLRFHDLRHTYAALMIAVNAHVKLLQHQMGHASVTITLNLYGHLYPEMTGPVMDALDALTTTKTPAPPAPAVEAEWKDGGDPR
jgi:integrase